MSQRPVFMGVGASVGSGMGQREMVREGEKGDGEEK